MGCMGVVGGCGGCTVCLVCSFVLCGVSVCENRNLTWTKGRKAYVILIFLEKPCKSHLDQKVKKQTHHAKETEIACIVSIFNTLFVSISTDI